MPKALYIALLALVIFAPTAHAGRKVAVIVDGGDTATGPNLSGSFTQAAEQTAIAYKNKGYEVIRISAATGQTAADFKTQIAALRGVDQLMIAFFTHGAVSDTTGSFESSEQKIVAFSTEQQARFPITYLRPDELESQSKFIGAPLKENAVRFGFIMQTPHGPTSPNYNFNNDSIGLGDMHAALAEAKLKNPTLQTTINSFSCFSGNATRILADIPGVQVFTASSASQEANIIAGNSAQRTNIATNDIQKCKDVGCLSLADVNFFPLKFIQAQQEKTPFLYAFTDANKNYFDAHIRNLDFNRIESDINLTLAQLMAQPESSLGLVFADQCLGAPPTADIASFCSPTNGTEPLWNLATSTIKPQALSFIKEGIAMGDHYLATLQTILDCDPRQLASDANILKTAMQNARNYISKKYKSQNAQDLALLKKKLNTLKTQILTATNCTELLNVCVRFQGVSSERCDILRSHAGILEFAKRQPNDFSSDKQDLVGIVDVDLNHVGDFFEQLSHFTDEYLQSSALDYENCLKDPLACDVATAFDTTELNPLQTLPMQSFDKLAHEARDGILLLNAKCSNETIFKATPGQEGAARTKQLQCLLANTKNDPLLRLYALTAAIVPLADADRKKTCDRLLTEHKRNQKLSTCAAKPDQLGDDTFWRKFSALYTQGMSASD